MLSIRESRELRALARRERREDSGLFLAEGVRVIEDLVASRLTIRMVVASSSIEDTQRGRELIRSAEGRGLDVRVVPRHDFERLAATETPQSVLAIAEIPEVSLEAIAASESPATVLVLDGIQDPGNFGTIVRSAEAFGVAGVVTLPGTVDPWNPKAVRASAGSSFRIPIAPAGWPEVADRLRASGFEIWGASMEGEMLPSRAGARVALVMGNEGAGLSAPVRAGLDRLVGVPTRGRAESLNVAAAAAILLYEITR